MSASGRITNRRHSPICSGRFTLIAFLAALGFTADAARAANLETGEPCNLGITTGSERMLEFGGLIVPPTSLSLLAAITAVMARRRMRTKSDPRSRRRWGVTVGAALAVLIVSIGSSVAVSVYFYVSNW